MRRMVAFRIKCGGKRQNMGGAKRDAEATTFAPFGRNRHRPLGHGRLSDVLNITTGIWVCNVNAKTLVAEKVSG